MADQTQTLSSEVNGRIVWFDGKESVEPRRVPEIIFERGALPDFVTLIDDSVALYNKLSPTAPLRVRTSCERPPPATWFQSIEAIDVEREVAQHLASLLQTTPAALHEAYISRVSQELREYERRGMFPILRACLYVVNTFRERNVVWGVGRGSAVASFVLYVIGIHDINSVKYGLELSEFIGEKDAT